MKITPNKDLEFTQLMGNVPDTTPAGWGRRVGKSVFLGIIIKYERAGRMEVMWL